MRPSEIIAAALSSGELTSQDVAPEASEGPETEKETETGNSSDLPTVPSLTDPVLPPAAPESDAALPDLAKESEEGEEEDGNSSDSDKESDYEPDESAEKNDAEEEVRALIYIIYICCHYIIHFPFVNTEFDTICNAIAGVRE